ncbi:fibronectin type III domain-containing protein [Candidatus Riflebacteria bacterium]
MLNYKSQLTKICLAFFSIIFIFWGCGEKINQVDDETTEINSVISGVVRDELTDEPLPLTAIAVVGQQITFPSDEKGEFFIPGLPPGDYSLKFERVGYTAKTVVFSLGVATTIKKNIILTRAISEVETKIDLVGKNSAALSVKTPQSPTKSTLRYGMDATSMVRTTTSNQITTNHVYTLTGLEENTTYYFRFELVDAVNPYSTTFTPLMTFTTDNGVAPQIGSVQAIVGSSKTRVIWSTDESASSIVYYGTSEDEVTQHAFEEKSDELKMSHSVTLSGLKQGSKYYYAVSSIDANGNITEDKIRTFITLALPDPTLLFAGNLSQNSAIMHWEIDENHSYVNSNFSRWLLEAYSSNPSTNTGISPVVSKKTAEKTSRTGQLEGLSGDTSYFFRLKIVDEGGNENSSQVIEKKTQDSDIYWDQEATAFSLVPEPTGAFIRAGAATDGSEAKGFIVGKNGRIARFSNSKDYDFKTFQSPTKLDIFAVSANSTGDESFAVGEEGLIIKFTNSDANTVPSGTDQALHCICNNGNGDYFVGGSKVIGRLASTTPLVRLMQELAVGTTTTWLGADYSTDAVGDKVYYVGTGGNAYEYVTENPASSTFFTRSINDHALYAIDFAGPPSLTDPGWMGGERSKILDPRTWSTTLTGEKVQTIGNETIKGIATLSPTKAYAVTNGGHILELDTTQSDTWRIIQSYPGLAFTGINFDPNTVNGYRLGIAVAKGNIVFFRKQD